MIRRLLGAMVLLVTAACGAANPSPTITVTVPPPAATTSTTVASAYEARECGSTPPRDWAILCRAFPLVVEHYVDPVDTSALAAAAALGVAGAGEDPEAKPLEGPLRCFLPDPVLEPVCEAMIDRLDAGPLPVAALVEAATLGMFRFGLDPFSSYVPPDFADRLDALGSGRVDTLGLVVGGRDAAGAACSPLSGACRFTVLAVFPFTAADRVGVVPGDPIVAVNGEAVDGLSADEATARMIGEPGTTLTLTFDRAAGRVDKALVHEDIRYEPAEFEMLGSVAYLRLNDFSQLAAQLTGRVLELDEVRRSSGLVLDLRDNPGGLVLSAQAVASQFLQGGLVMREENAEESVDVPVVEGGLAPRLRLVVLVNRGSASASEIVAAVLQERGRATVVGERTFGKNLVQQVFSAGNGGEIRVTVARWTTPNGGDIGVRGLTPDVTVVDPPNSEYDPALETAVGLLVGG